MKNAKNSNANLYCNFPQQFKINIFLSRGGHVPPLESPMSDEVNTEPLGWKLFTSEQNNVATRLN